MRNGLLAVALLAIAASAAHADDGEKNFVLPVRKVVLYKHGLGYFERRGDVDGSGSASLRFSSGQMNDVLKSLTALDLGGGRVSAIGYDSQAPAQRLLSEFGFTLPGEGAIVALLERFRGAQVEVALGAKTVRGSVVGVEPREVVVGDKIVKASRVTLLTADGSAHSFDAEEVQSVQFLDHDLAEDVARYLEILRDSYRAERKSMQLQLEGSGKRAVTVSYTVEVPVWKASYRLMLGERNLLQGWAIVDNTSDEDWNEVELSLVAGLPVSFVQDLYTPRYTRRPVVEVEQELAVAPQTHEGGWSDKRLADGADESKGGEHLERRSGRPAAANAPAKDAAPTTGGAGFLSGKIKSAALDAVMAEATTWTREVGDLFEYRIEHPVTVKRNRSALIPIVGAPVEATKLALFNAQERAGNPLSAVRFKNTTGLTLEGGPVTVLDGDTYAGEALIETLEPGEERYLTYAVDLAVDVDTKQESGEERIERVRCLNGILLADARVVTTTTYTLRNGDEKARTVVIEHARRPGFDLVQPKKMLEETPQHRRFSVDVAAKQTAAFVVKEESGQQSRIDIASLGGDQLDLFVRRKMISSEMEKALHDFVVARGEIAELERKSAALRDELAAIATEQDRLRKNLGALGQTSAEQQLRSRYVEQLGKGEDRITAINTSRQELDAQLAAKKSALAQKIQALALSADF